MSQATRSVRAVTLAVAVLALATGVAVAQPRQIGGVGITVFDDVNFQGATLTFSSDVPDMRRFNLNDRISSLQVPPDESWEVCENNNFGGRCVVVSGSERDLRTRGLSDSITSMRRVENRQGRFGGAIRNDGDGDAVGIAVSDNVDFQGASATFGADVPDLRNFRLNDRISSVRVSPGESWEICEDRNYAGRCVVVSGAARDLRKVGLNDAITSMRRVQDRGNRDDRGGFTTPRQSGSELVLFDQPGYRGVAQIQTEAAAGLGAFSNRAQSAQILSGVWELCEEPRWGGRCVRIESSVPDLQRIGLRGVASARPIDPPR